MTKCDTHLWIQSNLKTLLSCDADIVGGKTQCTLGPSLRDSDTSLAKPLKGKKFRQKFKYKFRHHMYTYNWKCKKPAAS